MDQFFTDQRLLFPPVARAAYSDRTAWIMAECSRVAYVSFEDDLGALKQALTAGEFELVATFNKQGTQAFLAMRDDMAILSFRGTEKSSDDIVTDMNLKFTETRMGKVHQGFHLAYQEVHKEIESAVDKIKDRPIYITGHSLGAALATIATWYLDRDNLAACYTFGSPRVGDRHLDMKIKTPVYRVVNDADIVTNLPMVSLRYEHVGSLYYLTEDGDLVRSPSFVSSSRQFVKVVIFRMIGTIENHFIANYCKKLKKIAAKRNPKKS